MKPVKLFEDFLNEADSKKELELKKIKLLNQAFKAMPNSPKQLKIRQEIEEVEAELSKLNEANDDKVTLNVTISNIDDETAQDFLKMFAFMEYCGNLGTARTMRAFFDGVGHFRPKIKVEGVDFKDVDMGLTDDNKEIDLDLGFGA
jgi:hypothetical protein